MSEQPFPLTHALEYAAVAFSCTDMSGVMTYVNPAFLSLWECERSDAVGKNIKEFLDNEHKGEELLRKARENGTWTGEMTISTKSGQKLNILFSASVVKDDKQAPAGFANTIFDITKRRQAEQNVKTTNRKLEETLTELRSTQQQLIDHERQRALTTMVSGIAHDFNNALSPIQGFSSMLVEQPDMLKNQDKALHYLKHIQQAADHATETIRRMRKFYRPREQDAFTSIDLNKVVKDAVSVTRLMWKEEAQASGKNIDIHTELGDIPCIEGNEAELNEILTNLIFNAVDAIPDEGTIRITTSMQEENVLLLVSDTGMGMSEETKQRCLDPFYSTKGPDGSGLGLAVLQGIIQRHLGDFTVESEEAKGTSFRILFPPSENEEDQESSAFVQNTSGFPSLTILIVEDKESQREFLKELLEHQGHIADVTCHGAQALEYFNKDRYDAVITDRATPQMNGDQLAAEIKSIAPEKPLIMLTGFGDMMEVNEGRTENIDKIISKPLTKEKLNAAFEQLLNQAANVHHAR